MNANAGEWIVKDGNGNVLYKTAYPEPIEFPQPQVFQSVCGLAGPFGGSVAMPVTPKRKPFPTKKSAVGSEAGEWIVKNVNGKMLFETAYPETYTESIEFPKPQVFQSVCGMCR